jgi:hypothetical protein
MKKIIETMTLHMIEIEFEKDKRGTITDFKERGMRTKSWTPLLILTKSEPVLYRAQSS